MPTSKADNGKDQQMDFKALIESTRQQFHLDLFLIDLMTLHQRMNDLSRPQAWLKLSDRLLTGCQPNINYYHYYYLQQNLMSI